MQHGRICARAAPVHELAGTAYMRGRTGVDVPPAHAVHPHTAAPGRA